MKRITLYEKFNLKSKPIYDYCSTQCDIHGELKKDIINFGMSIPDEHLAEDGRETDIHVTVKFGIVEYKVNEIDSLVEGFGVVTAMLQEISLFESEEFDVVKISVGSPDLHRLNKLISNNMETHDTHPTYNPHVTIAYVNPGYGKLYVSDDRFFGIELKFDHLTFSTRYGNKLKIPLT